MSESGTSSSELTQVAADEVATSGAKKTTAWSRRVVGFLTFLIVLALLFSKNLFSLFVHAFNSELHSYIIFIPFVSAYLVYIEGTDLLRRRPSRVAPKWASIFVVAAFAALATSYAWPLSRNDYLALTTFSFVCFIGAGGFLFLGREVMSAVAFPFAFLYFLVPLPDRVVDWLETASQLASAEVASLLFQVSGTPALRDKTVFELPGIVIRVAQECSGIRSSWILFITSLVAAHLFLKNPWRKAFLVLFVIPLGIVRNGFRIFTIALLCVNLGPQMIHSPIHRKGGPLFFALSLVPLGLLLWWLRRGEGHATQSGNE